MQKTKNQKIKMSMHRRHKFSNWSDLLQQCSANISIGLTVVMPQRRLPNTKIETITPTHKTSVTRELMPVTMHASFIRKYYSDGQNINVAAVLKSAQDLALDAMRFSRYWR